MHGSGVNGLLLRLFPPNLLRVQGSPRPLVAMSSSSVRVAIRCGNEGCEMADVVIWVMRSACIAGVTRV